MLDKRAQVADTTTWIVATLIVAVVLTIGIFVTNFVGSNKQIIFLDDKKKDFVATKSAVNFLKNEENVKLLNGENEKKIETKLMKFSNGFSQYNLNYLVGSAFLLKADTGNSGIGQWGVELEKNDKESKIRIYCGEVSTRDLSAPLLLRNDFSIEETKLKLGVEECF